MALAVFTPAYYPSTGSGFQRNARLIENQFGDGYRQTAPDGLNALVSTATLTWELLSTGQADYIDNFLTQNLGRAFFWTAPGGVAVKYDCKAWTRTNVYGSVDKISATFTQRFDLQN